MREPPTPTPRQAASPPPSAPAQWTTRALQAWMTDAFTRKDLDSPRLMAELLLAHVLGCERLKLFMDPDRPASPLERETLRGLVTRALKHEPVQYLTGEASFFGLLFKVDRRVLIPRPSTETIVEHVLQHVRASHGPSASKASAGEGLLIADVCTGSGAIAVALMKHLPAARCVATDISADALDVARENAQRHGVAGRIDFLLGDLLAPLREYPPSAGEGQLAYLVSNPPYIPDDEWGAVEPNVKEHEPHLALRGGVDGLDLVRPLLRDGYALLREGGQMLVEVADARAGEALAVAQSTGGKATLLRDWENLQRVVVLERPRAAIA